MQLQPILSQQPHYVKSSQTLRGQRGSVCHDLQSQTLCHTPPHAALELGVNENCVMCHKYILSNSFSTLPVSVHFCICDSSVLFSFLHNHHYVIHVSYFKFCQTLKSNRMNCYTALEKQYLYNCFLSFFNDLEFLMPIIRCNKKIKHCFVVDLNHRHLKQKNVQFENQEIGMNFYTFMEYFTLVLSLQILNSSFTDLNNNTVCSQTTRSLFIG